MKLNKDSSAVNYDDSNVNRHAKKRRNKLRWLHHNRTSYNIRYRSSQLQLQCF